ncbi:shikimate dehydrogenase [Noviherbaspirillum pedocola]|uniref:Shikimate dehydrogenase (NADP(+)) n=1 Tax=Noviherbaspirillum pedocola TaxID=2801341 RepID=A0A934W7R2_9BURK|nr:shikimate dehydrogenase [Noviherbaspirillum pedocola]MBK4736675.1 shikimate dehydrogenase [Noviherbaspirillum pedocola]
MNERKLLVGLIGAGIQKSLSPAMHEEEARHHGMRLFYQIIDLDAARASVDDLPTLIRAARIMRFAGLNITYPCKQAVIPLLDDLSDEARAMGAVNTVVNEDGRLIGHNTDGWGWSWGFRRQLPDADLSRVVLLGAGGAGAAIAHAVLRLGAQHLVLVDQDPARAQALAENLNALYGAHRASAQAHIEAALQGATGLIHATPTGMDKLPGMPLDASLLHAGLWVSEVVYFPLETALLKAARAAGCKVADGGGMAVGQAVGAFRLFTGEEPDAARMDAHLRAMVAGSS